MRSARRATPTAIASAAVATVEITFCVVVDFRPRLILVRAMCLSFLRSRILEYDAVGYLFGIEVRNVSERL